MSRPAYGRVGAVAAKPKTEYHARFELDPSGNWLASLVEIPQVQTFGKSLGKARENLLDALALWLGQHVVDLRASVSLVESVSLPGQAQAAVDLARGAREILDAVTREFNDLTAAASLALVDDAHLSVRDAASMLDISHQRVHQIVASVHAERRAEQVRKNLVLVQQHMEQQSAPVPFGQLTANQALLAIALIVVGGALVAAASK